MSEFDIDEFERRLDALLHAYKRLQSDNRALEASLQAEQERNREARARLSGVIERIRALEAQAASGQENA